MGTECGAMLRGLCYFPSCDRGRCVHRCPCSGTRRRRPAAPCPPLRAAPAPRKARVAPAAGSCPAGFLLCFSV